MISFQLVVCFCGIDSEVLIVFCIFLSRNTKGLLRVTLHVTLHYGSSQRQRLSMVMRTERMGLNQNNVTFQTNVDVKRVFTRNVYISIFYSKKGPEWVRTHFKFAFSKSYIRRKLCTGRQPIVHRVVARKTTDWSKFSIRCETGNSIGLYSMSECTRKLLIMKTFLLIKRKQKCRRYVSTEFNTIVEKNKMLCNVWTGL